jgi:hypothetical protein
MRTESEGKLRTNAGCGCALSIQPSAVEKNTFSYMRDIQIK